MSFITVMFQWNRIGFYLDFFATPSPLNASLLALLNAIMFLQRNSAVLHFKINCRIQVGVSHTILTKLVAIICLKQLDLIQSILYLVSHAMDSRQIDFIQSILLVVS